MRKFIIDDRLHDDPSPDMTLEQVKDAFTPFYPELSNAQILPAIKKDGDDTEYVEFKRVAGTKGSGAPTEPGYWWFRHEMDEPWEIAHVVAYGSNGRLCVRRQGKTQILYLEGAVGHDWHWGPMVPDYARRDP